jgi:hypothetical protein
MPARNLRIVISRIVAGPLATQILETTERR